ncbi:hypothetical protein EsDP_00004603 [Epichloe bromicola]|uniref:LysM domain-containing protein n=1 Tax=Epichloe bromicola TaxID=79588 RepID=A0ABQ0CSN1_9HYPO
MRLFGTSHRSVALAILLVLPTMIRGLPAMLVDPVHVENPMLIPREEKGPEDDYDTHVSLINATPYRWHKTYNNSYQLMSWESTWPMYITPGQSVTVRANNFGYGLRNRYDSAGEVTYALEGTQHGASFQVQYRSGRPHHVWIQFREQLETLNNAQRTEHNLGFSRLPGGVGFVLAGKEGDFISNDGPIQWMQAQLPEIQGLPLREITLPRSHHAGLWKCGEAIGLAQPRNTQTQTVSLFDQLGNGGVRVLDVRPLLRNRKFRESHGSFLGHTYNGMTGTTLREMVETFNDFTSQYPGELYIWDIHEGDSRNGDRGFRPLDDDDLKELYSELGRIKHRGSFSEGGEDLTRRPLKHFITPKLMQSKKSTVLVRIPSSWALRKHFPGSKEGFVTGLNFPLKSHWSKTNDVQKMMDDQLSRLREARGSRASEMYNMDWLLTQVGIQVAFPLDSIMELSRAAWRTLYGEFWQALTDQTYPNMVTMDDIHGNSHKALAMVMNKCLAARRCGDLGGKVKGLNETV